MHFNDNFWICTYIIRTLDGRAIKMVTKDWKGMKVRGSLPPIFVSVDDSKFPVKHYVKDEEGNILFETEGETSEVAIQWAIDYQSSKEKANLDE